MFCPYCGKESNKEGSFCHFCGKSIEQPVVSPQTTTTSGLAIAILVLGIAGLTILPLLIPSLLAVIFGSKAQKEQNVGGRGLATAGKILGWIGLSIWIAVCVYFIVLQAMPKKISVSPLPPEMEMPELPEPPEF